MAKQPVLDHFTWTDPRHNFDTVCWFKYKNYNDETIF